jgi:hypothetical protein
MRQRGYDDQGGAPCTSPALRDPVVEFPNAINMLGGETNNCDSR